MSDEVPTEAEVQELERMAELARREARRLEQVQREQTGSIRGAAKAKAKRKAVKAARRRARR